MTRTRLVLIAALVALMITGGGLAAAASLLADDPASHVRELDVRQLGEKVAAFPPEAGRPDSGVYVARLGNGSICVNAATATRKSWSGGCNPASAPLGGKPFIVLFTYDGGPAVETVKDARLFGLADRSVKQLRVEMSDHSSRELRLSPNAVASTPYRVFAHRVSRDDLAAGIAPVAVTAFDAAGSALARQPTGLPPAK